MTVDVDAGLVFSIPLSEKIFGFGQLIAWQKPIFYMVAYDARSEHPNIDEDRLRLSKPVLMGNFFDILIRNGRWKPIRKLTVPKIVFPCFKIKIGDKFYVESWDRQRKREATSADVVALQPRSNYGPVILENALRAYFGLRPWETSFDSLKAENVDRIAGMCRFSIQ